MYSFVSDNRGDKVLSNAIAWKLVSGNEICITTGNTGEATIEYSREMPPPQRHDPETILIRARAGVNLVGYQGKNM